MAWTPPDEIGESDPLLPAARKYLARFSYGAKLKGTSSEVIDADYLAAQRQFKVNRHVEIVAGLKPGPDLNPDSAAFDWATKTQMGLLAPAAPKVKPIIFTVEGHMSDMWSGPCADTASQLAAKGLVIHQPIGYDCTALPFNNASGVQELARLVGALVMDNGVPFPLGNPWGLMGFSQGAMVVCEFMMKYVLPEDAPLHWRLKDFRRGLAFGNPRREKDACAPWVLDKPAAGTSGIMDVLFNASKTAVAGRWQEHPRKGDMFAENTSDRVGMDKTAIAKIVTENSWAGGPAALLARIVALFGNPVGEALIALVAIIQAIMFAAANPNPHYSTIAEPGDIEWMRGVAA